MQDPSVYVQQLGQSARRAAQELVSLNGAAKVAALHAIAEGLRAGEAALLEANSLDLRAAEEAKRAAEAPTERAA